MAMKSAINKKKPTRAVAKGTKGKGLAVGSPKRRTASAGKSNPYAAKGSLKKTEGPVTKGAKKPIVLKGAVKVKSAYMAKRISQGNENAAELYKSTSKN
jgi:hypothetical protein